VQIDLEECRRIAALIVVAIVIVMINVVRAYWPKGQVVVRPAVLEARTEAERYVRGEAMDLNLASEEELEILPGVGPAVARRLVEARPFETFEDVDRVKGVGPVLVGRLKEVGRLR
jgi:competence protein ComEA